MKHLLGAMLAIALCTPLAATERLGLRSQVLQVRVRESLPMQVLGATAAWAVDPNIVQVGTLNGIVTLTGRAAGTTRIVILTAAGEQTLEVVVSAPRNATGPTAVDKQQNGQAEVRYSSADRSLQNTVTVRKETAGRTTEINVRNVNYGSGAPGEHAAVTVPSASYRIFTRNRELTLLDRVVDHSPLTLSGTTLRGAHYLDEHWRIHAGVTAYAAYQSFLLPTEREPVVGVGYKVGSFTPSAFVYPGQGALLSLLYDYAPMDGVIGRAEVAVGHGVGGAVQLAVDRGRDRARLDVRYRPESLPGVKATQMSGLVADGSWSRSTSRGSYVALGFSAADYDSIDIRTVTANADGAWRLNDRLSLLGGVSYGAFDATRSVTVPAGVQLDFRRGSLTALYRYARNSATNTGGNGFRVAARTSLGRVGINGYVDRQEQAPTLSLIFREQPQLALALEQLGISATSPADIARALRENAELIALGYIDGVTVDLAPTRTQAALELSFLGTSASRHQLRARILRNRVESVARAVDTTIATVSYARRLTPATDVFAAYTYWRTEARDQDAYVQPFIELGVRHRFNDLPSFGGGTIAGVVFIDEDLDGQSDGRGVADAEVELDGARRIKTAADGAFAFDNVRGGAHQVVARVRDAPAAYFTTPSRVDAVAGEPVTFGVAWTPARLQGRVTSDAGVGIAGVGVIVSRGAKQYRATTASDGSYAIIAPPGEWTMDIVPDSVPSGYSLTGIASRDVTLVREEPRQADLSLRANRSISGRATPHAEIVVEPLGKRVNADADGHFTVRSLPAGEVTLHMRGIIRPLLVPREPSALVVDFVEAAPQPAVRTIVSGERTDTMHWVVQIGAYRLRSNALEALHRARRTGVAATMTETPTLAIVRAGPYPTRAHADEAAEALERSGMNVIVQKSNGVR